MAPAPKGSVMRLPSLAPFLEILSLQITGTERPARLSRITVAFSGWDGTAQLVSLTATIEIPWLDLQRPWQEMQHDLITRLHKMLNPALLRGACSQLTEHRAPENPPLKAAPPGRLRRPRPARHAR
jgi:hypothetical protein